MPLLCALCSRQRCKAPESSKQVVCRRTPKNSSVRPIRLTCCCCLYTTIKKSGPPTPCFAQPDWDSVFCAGRRLQFCTPALFDCGARLSELSQRFAREADHHIVIWIIDLIRFHLVYPINDGHRPSMAVSTLAARISGIRACFVVPGASRCSLAGLPP